MKQKESGFSLVEVIVGMFLILLIFELVVIEVGALRISKSQRYENIAYHIANKQMEDLRAIDFATLPNSGTISDSQLALIPSGSGSFTVADYPNYSGIKELIVTVGWLDGSNKSVIIKSLAGNGGLNP